MKRDENTVRDEILAAVDRMDRTKLEKLRIFIAGMEAAKKQRIPQNTVSRNKRMVI